MKNRPEAAVTGVLPDMQREILSLLHRTVLVTRDRRLTGAELGSFSSVLAEMRVLLEELARQEMRIGNRQVYQEVRFLTNDVRSMEGRVKELRNDRQNSSGRK